MWFYVDLRPNFDSSKLQLCWAHIMHVSCVEMEDGTDPHLKNCSTGHQHRSSDLIIFDQFDQPCEAVGSQFWSLNMLLAELLCWWLFQFYKSFANILILLSRHFVSNLRHLHRPPKRRSVDTDTHTSRGHGHPHKPRIRVSTDLWPQVKILNQTQWKQII